MIEARTVGDGSRVTALIVRRDEQDSDGERGEVRCSGVMLSKSVADRRRTYTNLHFRVVGWCKACGYSHLQVGS